MNIKSLITTSIIALISASAVQASDAGVPHEGASVITVPSFSWTGFYIGGQGGKFSSKVEITDPVTKNQLFNQDDTPKPSGFMKGIYAGFNIGLGNNLILGIETDAILANQEETKSIFIFGPDGGHKIDRGCDCDKKSSVNADGNKKFIKIATPRLDYTTSDASFTLKEKWSGATRARIGFAAAYHLMPYVAGGIAYAQMQGISTVDVTGRLNSVAATAVSATRAAAMAVSTVKTMTMVGYTVGGGVDFAMTDNVILRAEYRYSDFGKKQFVKDTGKFSYKTNDFRVGAAFKF
ncbi:porin [Bartonella raoultii]|uniref:porin n=1 Tax=Bartonella raoultii TaxID=1457020 RepID=UPI001ABAE57A|nr:porin [Bartonella raoultii]